MMKKLSAAVMAAALIFTLAACGINKDAASTGSGPAVSASSSPAAGGAAAGNEVKITATNYQFDQKEYHVKKGQPVTFVLDNKEGVHGIAIKDLNVNMSGGTKSQTVTPDKAGTYDIRCSVVCGSGHSTMVSKLIVE